MPWHPPIPAGALWSEQAIKLGPGLALLAWLYDRVERDGTCTLVLQRAADDLGKPYGTIRDWWRAIRQGPFLAEQEDRGRGGWWVRVADDWLDWHVLNPDRAVSRRDVNDKPENALENAQFNRRDVNADTSEENCQRRNVNDKPENALENAQFNRRDVNGIGLHIGTHDDHGGGGGMITESPRPGRRELPPPPAADAGELPEAIRQAARDWLHPDRPVSGLEAEHLRSLLQGYRDVWDGDWLVDAIRRCVAEGGRSLGYLDSKLRACRKDGKRPGAPKPERRQERAPPARVLEPPRPGLSGAEWAEMIRASKQRNAS